MTNKDSRLLAEAYGKIKKPFTKEYLQALAHLQQMEKQALEAGIPPEELEQIKKEWMDTATQYLAQQEVTDL